MSALTIINRSAPYGSADGLEALDLCLAAASFGQQVNFIFLDDGIFQLLSNQAPNEIEHKNYSKTFAALEFYDVEYIYVCEESLAARNLSTKDLCIEVTLLNKQEIVAMLNTNAVVTF